MLHYTTLFSIAYLLPITQCLHLQPSVLILKTLFRIVCSPSFMFYLPHSPSYSPTPDSVPILHSYMVCPVCLMSLTLFPPFPFPCGILFLTLCASTYTVFSASHAPSTMLSLISILLTSMPQSACFILHGLMSDAPFSACLLLCPQSVPMYVTLRALVSTPSCYSRVVPSAPHPYAPLSTPALHTIVLLVCSLFVLHSPHSAVHVVFYCP